MGTPNTARDAAVEYIRQGRYPVPVPFKTKGEGKGKDSMPTGWPDLRVTEDKIDTYFPAGKQTNVGLITGVTDGTPQGEVVLDIDCAEALRAADLVLHKTGSEAGRKGNPRSHRHYTVDAVPAKAHTKYLDPMRKGKDAVLVEIISTGGMVVAPPSVHPDTGETYTWSKNGTPATVTFTALEARARHLAAAALLGRYWSEGNRHDAALALAGGLLRAGWVVKAVMAFMKAVCVAAQDPELKDRYAAVRDTAKKLRPEGQSVFEIKAGEKVTGWPRLAELIDKAVVDSVCEWLGVARSEGPAVAAVPEVPWPAPMDPAAFSGPAGEFVRAVGPHTEADPHGILVQLLVLFGNVIGRTAHWTVNNDIHYLNEFALLVGPTGKGRKGLSFGLVRGALAGLDPAWTDHCLKGGLASGEGLIHAIRDQRTKVVDGVEEVVDEGVADKRLVCEEQEFSAVLKVASRPGNTVGETIRKAWDGRPLRNLSKSSPDCCQEPHVSIAAHITEDEYRATLTSTDQANGFCNRIITACVKRWNVLPEGGRIPEDEYQRLRDLFRQSFDFAKSVKTMGFTPEGRAAWHAVYPALSEGRPGLTGAMLGRAEAHVRRLAGIYALLDLKADVDVPHLMAATAVWDYVEASVRHIFGDRTGNEVADKILVALRGATGGMTRDELMNLFGRHRKSGEIDEALGLLLTAKLAHSRGEKTGGRPATRWFIGAAR
jgi:hypothetical protein